LFARRYSFMAEQEEHQEKQELITLAEAARLYGFSHGYLRQLARRGRLRATKIGRDWLTTPADVEAYIASRQKRGVYRDDIQY
jgi:excisionase family DNA binding protein